MVFDFNNNYFNCAEFVGQHSYLSNNSFLINIFKVDDYLRKLTFQINGNYPEKIKLVKILIYFFSLFKNLD
jgi:hypothetical protein